MAIKLDTRAFLHPEVVPVENPTPVKLPDPTDLEAVQALAETVERFYISPEELNYVRNPHYTEPLRFNPEQLLLLRVERPPFLAEFYDDEEYADMPSEEECREIGLRTRKCPDCNDTGVHKVPFVGKRTGVKILSDKRCRCQLWQRFYEVMENSKNVGVAYRRVRLRNLMRFSANFNNFRKKEGALAELIETVNKFPGNNYLLAGPAGQGKSTLLTALYADALAGWAERSFLEGNFVESVWIVNATTLAAEQRAWEMKDDGRDENEGKPTRVPTVTVEKIQRAIDAGYTPALFLEEFDKFKDSDFQLNLFFKLIDLVHNAGGRVVVTSNVTEYDMRKKMKEQYGGGIIRRLTGPRGNPGVDYTVDQDTGKVTQAEPPTEEGGFYIDFWNARITQNMVWDSPNEQQLVPNRSTAHVERSFDGGMDEAAEIEKQAKLPPPKQGQAARGHTRAGSSPHPPDLGNIRPMPMEESKIAKRANTSARGPLDSTGQKRISGSGAQPWDFVNPEVYQPNEP